MPEWVTHAIFWQVYPLGFVGADIRSNTPPGAGRRLGRLIDWLDYAVELGASALLLGPMFASSTHGYDTVDHFRLDSRLGDESDFEALIAAATKRGLRVVLDGVFNHVSRAFPAFQEVLAQGRGASRASWFRLSSPQGSADGREPEYATFEGHRNLVVLNHDEPAVADYVVGVMNHWLDRGASGWRLDAAYAVPSKFWARVLPRVREAHPDAYIFGEVTHGDYRTYVNQSGLDAITQYELWKAIWSSLNDCNFFELAWALGRHNQFLEDFVPQTFLGNHDVTRLASLLADERHIEHALAILLACGGTPSIYSGDEQGFRGIKEHRVGGDDAIRPAFPPSPDRLKPFGWRIYRAHQDLIGFRRRHAWLHRARSRIVHLANARITFETFHEPRRLMVALNLDGAGDQPSPGMRSIVAGRGTLIRPGEAGARIGLPGPGWAILAPEPG